MGAFVENDIIQLEYAMWEAVVHGDIEGFKKLVRADAQDLAGLFHVVSIWKKKEETWNLLFNMDARIFEA